MVLWENTGNEEVWREIRAEIQKATNGNPPAVFDPFCGGGSIPLEAQRLGLHAHGSDLNPVAVLVTKALIEIPAKFAGQPPVNPDAQGRLVSRSNWPRAQGLAADVRHYGQWMRDEAVRRIGHLYPMVALPEEVGGGEATVVAWFWTRTVVCPNPACGCQMPLVRSFGLSKSKKQAWLQPRIDRTQVPPSIHYNVVTGRGIPPVGTINRQGATCICCGASVPFDYIRTEARLGRMGSQLLAIAAEARVGRIYLEPNAAHAEVASLAVPDWKPETDLPLEALGFRVQRYGMTKHADLFTSRQLVALTTFGNLIREARRVIERDASESGMFSSDSPDVNGKSARAYSNAVATYLAFALDKCTNYWSVLCSWNLQREGIVSTFGLPVLSMVWDYTEANPFSGSSGNWLSGVEQAAKSLSGAPAQGGSNVIQQDATTAQYPSTSLLFSTDPPYYDNVGYADLSDFFYTWLRYSVADIYPELFRTLLVPKKQELIASPYRFDGDKHAAKHFFEEGLVRAFTGIRVAQSSEYPLTVYYAFKQTESDESHVNSATDRSVQVSTGWETMLEGLIRSEFAITGTWPMRTEQSGGLRESGRNALASSIVLVCRPRLSSASEITRRQFISALRDELPEALRHLQHGNIAPVDLAQAAIGPGMAVFSRFKAVLEANGLPMRVRTALHLINQMLDEVLAEQEAEYDADTRWAVAWHAQYGMEEGPFGDAETLAKVKNASVQGLVSSGILHARAGKVRLLRREELPNDWDPRTDTRCTLWEVTQYLISALDNEGENAAAALLLATGEQGELARDLAYRLYTTCERKGWVDEARYYNMLVVAWGGITGQAQEQRDATPQMEQSRLV